MKLMRKLVTHGLKLNKKRTIVTIIGIILAVALLSALSTLVSSFRGSLISYQRQKDGNFHVSIANMEEVDRNALYRNRQIENVFEISQLGYAKLDGCRNENKPYAFVVATDANGLENGGFKLLEGRMPEKESEIVIPKHLQTNGRIVHEIGDTISLEIGARISEDMGCEVYQDNPFYIGEHEEIANAVSRTYTIVGVIDRPGYDFEPYTAPGYTFLTYQETSPAGANTNAYIRFTNSGLRHYVDYTADIVGASPEALAVFWGDIDYSTVTEEQLQESFTEMESAKYTPNPNTWLIRYERIWPVDSTFAVVLGLAGIVAVIILLTSIYCIKNSFDISVNEKIHLYGMLAGIGATKKQIRKSVYSEAAIMGAIGIPIGIISGLFASFVLIIISNKLLAGMLNVDLTYIPSWIAILLATVLGIVTIWLSSARSAHKAGKVSPIEAIRNQNEIKLNSKKIKAPKYISKLWGIGGVISYKNIKRNKKKYRTTVVSIVICSVTFIVISYFMSMGFELVGTAVADESCNVYFNASGDLSESEIRDSLYGIEGIEQFSIIRRSVVYTNEYTYTDEYSNYITSDNADYVTYDRDSEYIQLAVLDDTSYAQYAKECSIKNETGKVIFFNLEVHSGVGEIQKYKFESKTINCYREDDSNAEFDKEGFLIEDSIEKIPVQFEIAGVTDERPFGFKAASNTMIFMSQSTFEGLGEFYDFANETSYYELLFEASDADKLQEDLEKMIMENPDLYAGDTYVNNVESSIRNERSVFTLLSIFAYGLIAVIALIGITNIFNTLSTSMELRAKDFATLRSIGMTNKQFHRMVRLESLFTSAKSLFVGCVMGYVISYLLWYMESTYDVMIVFHPPIKAILICIAVVLILVYAIIRSSLVKINKRNIIETIKNENV